MTLIVYTYAAYPLALVLWVRIRSRTAKDEGQAAAFTGSFSIILCAYNEAERIATRINELSKLVRANSRLGEIIVISDGSMDNTAAVARATGCGATVIEMPENLGKAAALTLGCAAARGDILVFADARQHWENDTLERLLGNFSRPEVGAVSGELNLGSSTTTLTGVGLYWRYERWIRRLEGLVHSTVGVSGSISAVRRLLFRPIPTGLVLDDLYWPMCVVLGGRRVVHDDRAKAFDVLPPNAKDELRRKIRTLSGNFQLMMALPAVLLPIRNPIWLQFVSHKVLRLLVPWLLIALLATSAMLNSLLFRGLFWSQVAFYGLAALHFMYAGSAASRRLPLLSRLTGTVASFVLLNTAAWLGFWIWLLGRTGLSWRKVRYRMPGDTV